MIHAGRDSEIRRKQSCPDDLRMVSESTSTRGLRPYSRSMGPRHFTALSGYPGSLRLADVCSPEDLIEQKEILAKHRIRRELMGRVQVGSEVEHIGTEYVTTVDGVRNPSYSRASFGLRTNSPVIQSSSLEAHRPSSTFIASALLECAERHQAGLPSGIKHPAEPSICRRTNTSA
ncbi:hypothetical protein BKA93DRAFT_786633 [Sparassis latifolia]